MSKTTIPYVEAIAVIAVVAAPVHYLAGLDWPWSIVLGAVGAIIMRALIHRGSTPPTTGQRT